MASTETIKFLLDIETKADGMRSVVANTEKELKKLKDKIEEPLTIGIFVDTDAAVAEVKKRAAEIKAINSKLSSDMQKMGVDLKIKVDTSGLTKLTSLYDKLAKKKEELQATPFGAGKAAIKTQITEIAQEIEDITSTLDEARNKLLKQAKLELEVSVNEEFKSKLAKDVFGAVKGGISKFASKDLFGAIVTTGGGIGKAGISHLERKEKESGGSGKKAAKIGMYMGGVAGIIGAFIGLLSAADTQFKEFSKSAVEAGGGLQFLKDTSGTTASGISSDSRDIFDGLEKYNDAIVNFDFNRMWRVDPKQHMEFLNAVQGAGVSTKDLQNIAGEAFTSFENDLMKNAVMLHLNLGVPLSEIGDALGTWVANLGMSLDDVKMSMAALSQDALSSGMQTKRFFDIVKNTTKGMGLYGIKVEETSSLLKELSMALGPDEAERAMAGIASFYHNESMQGSIRALAIGGRRGTKAVEGSVNRSVDRAIGDGGTTTKENRLERIKTLKGIRDALIPKMQNKTATAEDQGKYRQVTAALSQANQFGKGGIMNAAMALPATDLQGKLEAKMAEIGRMTGIYDIGDMDKMSSRSKLAAEGAGVMNDEQFRQLSALGSYVKDIGGGSLEKAIATMSDEQKKALMGNLADPAKETAENTTTMADALGNIIPAILNKISGGIYDIVDFFANKFGSDKDKKLAKYREAEKRDAKEIKDAKANAKSKYENVKKQMAEGKFEAISEEEKKKILDENQALYDKDQADIAQREINLKGHRAGMEAVGALPSNSNKAAIEVAYQSANRTTVDPLAAAEKARLMDLEMARTKKEFQENKARLEREQKDLDKVPRSVEKGSKEDKALTALNKSPLSGSKAYQDPSLDASFSSEAILADIAKATGTNTDSATKTADVLTKSFKDNSLQTNTEITEKTQKDFSKKMAEEQSRINNMDELKGLLDAGQMAKVRAAQEGGYKLQPSDLPPQALKSAKILGLVAQNTALAEEAVASATPTHDGYITKGGLARVLPGEVYKPAQIEQRKTGALASNGGSGANITININGGDINIVKQTVLGILYDHERRRATA